MYSIFWYDLFYCTRKKFFQNCFPIDVESTKCTLKYLESCNLIFEQGLLSHERVKEKDAKILINIQQGYSLLCDWLDNIVKNGT